MPTLTSGPMLRPHVITALLACTVGCNQPAAVHLDGDIAFVNVNVIPMDGERVLRDRTVVIDDGVIASITPSVGTTLADSVQKIDGRERYLIPGLADMHVHIWDEFEPRLYIAYGVTTVRNMWGEDWTLELRERIRAGELVGPRIMTAGRIVDGAPRIHRGSDEVEGSDAGREVVDRQVRQGFDFIKIYSNLGRTAFSAIADAAKRTGIPFAGHTPIAVGLRDMLLAGPESIEHLRGWNAATTRDGVDLGSGYRSPEMYAAARRIRLGELTLDDVFDPTKRTELAALAARSGVANVPTLIVTRRTGLTRDQAKAQMARDAMKFVSPGIREFWDPDKSYRQNDRSEEEIESLQVFLNEAEGQVKALYEAGAPLLAGSDAPNPFVFHGLSLHEELEQLVGAGIPPYDTLRAATSSAARFLNAEGDWGLVAEGSVADLVLLGANPLDDISNSRRIEGVMQNGRWRNRGQLDALLAEVADAYASPPDWFAGRASLSEEFDARTGNAAMFRASSGGRETNAERLIVADTNNHRRVLAQGAYDGFVDSEYSIQRRLSAGGEVVGSSFRRYDIVPSRETTVDCDATSCALRVDGAEQASVDGGTLTFLVGAPSDIVTLSGTLARLAVGEATAVRIARLEIKDTPMLVKGRLNVTRLPDAAAEFAGREVEARHFEFGEAGDVQARVWIADSGLPLRIGRFVADSVSQVWLQETPAAGDDIDETP